MNSKLLEKYFKGACSPEEVQEVLNWFKSEELNQKQEQDLNQLWQEAEEEKENTKFTVSTNRLFDKINQAIDNPDVTSVRVSKAEAELVPVKSKWPGLFRIAAAVLIPLCFLWVYATYFSRKESATPIKYVTMQPAPNARRIINLEDGSKITLNAGSQVSYPEHFPKFKREIKLSGEAFFEIAKDKQRPFIVKTGTISTQALGTSFNIKFHPEDNFISVALATGSVKIDKHIAAGSRQIAQLIPGQQLVYNKTKQKYQILTYEPLEVLGWREGILSFKKASLNQVTHKLEDWYGIEIEVAGKVPVKKAEWNYTGSYQNQSLDDVLKGIGFVKDFTYEKKGDKIKIKFN